jgi:hypothetical protein
MVNGRTLAGAGVGIVLLTTALGGEQAARYRDFELKTDVATVLALTGAPASDTKTIHERPALLQDLMWRPSRWVPGSTAASIDPVDEMTFSFFNNQLFRIVVDYAHDRTEGMTDADMTEAISTVYGAPGKRLPGIARVASRVEAEAGSRVAQWGTADYAVVLYHASSYGSAFRLIVTESALDALARKAAVQALRLDDQDAPRREVARQKKELDDRQLAAQKARNVNKAVFKP